MKKYFMQETAEELKFGDMIVLDLSHDMKNGHIKHHHLECKFIPELVPIFLEEGVIVEKEVKDEKPLDSLDNDALNNLVKEIIEANEKLELRVDKLEEQIELLTKALELLTEINKSKKQCRGTHQKVRK